MACMEFTSNSQHTPDPSRHIRKIFVHESCRDLPYTREILARAHDIPVEIIRDDALPELEAGPYPTSLAKGKRHLLLSRNRGSFFKPCPGTREYRCCDYHVLNIGMNCPMDCVYCILQAYLNNPWLSFFVNVDDLTRELEEDFIITKDFRRIGTGEFTDSMALDRLTGLAPVLVDFIKDKDSAILELKTKSAAIDNLAGLDHRGRTIVAWSLNSPIIINKEEFRTADLEQRLAAAATCADWGYPLAFHFDPIIYHQGWQDGYRHTIKRLFDLVPADRIAWISLGALRFLPALRPIADSRFPSSRFFHEEFIIGLDNKYRYFRDRRVDMYRFILNLLRQHCADHTCIYFCMESDEIWQECEFEQGASVNLALNLDKAAGVVCR